MNQITERDKERIARINELLASGMTYDQVARRLRYGSKDATRRGGAMLSWLRCRAVLMEEWVPLDEIARAEAVV